MSQLKKAISYLEIALSQGIFKPGDRLPGLRTLCKNVGVSSRTMDSAVHNLSQKNLLSIVPKSGIRVPLPNGYQEQNFTETVEKWKKIRDTIANDLFSRKLDSLGKLPTIAELCNRYGVNYPILKKALCSLEKEGLLTSYKKSYKPNLISASRQKTKLLVLCNIFPDQFNDKGINLNEQGFNLSSRVKVFIQELEHLCNSQNFQAEIWGYFFENNSITFFKPDRSICHSIENFKNYYGICLVNALPYSQDHDNLLFQLAKGNLPISIFEISGQTGWTIPPTKNRSIRVFLVGVSDLPGKKIGSYLLELGHREIAYISPWYEDGWTKNRYNGLCTVFGMTQGSHVNLYVDSRFATGDIFLDNKELNEQILNLSSFEKLLDQMVPLSKEHIETIDFEVGPAFNATMYRRKLEIFLQPLFEKALQNPKITAWVCADDHMAISALRFLRKKGVEVPEKISVVGIEDNFEAIYTNLTTYNFDIRGVVQNMVAFISNHSFFQEKQGFFLEKNGFLVPRGSTGPVRKEIGD